MSNKSSDSDNEEFLFETPSLISPTLYRGPPHNSLKKFIRSSFSEDSDNIEEQNSAPLKCNNDLPGCKHSKFKNAREYFNYIDNGCYYKSPLGEFLMEIGNNLVSEYVCSDITRSGETQNTNLSSNLKQECDRFDRLNPQTRFKMRICKDCQFQTESSLVLSSHKETPHKVNNAYKCHICSFEVASLHLHKNHMKTEHSIIVRIEKPLTQQCNFCPFENTSSEKVEIHNLRCRNKLKLNSILKPDDDWDPPAKINQFDARVTYVNDKPPIKKFSLMPSVYQQIETIFKPHNIIIKPTTSNVPLTAMIQKPFENTELPIRQKDENKQQSKLNNPSMKLSIELIKDDTNLLSSGKSSAASKYKMNDKSLSGLSNPTLKQKETQEKKMNSSSQNYVKTLKPQAVVPFSFKTIKKMKNGTEKKRM